MIDRPALLEINRKIATMGGGGISSCRKKGLCLFGVCLFFEGFWRFEKIGLPRKKKLAGRLGLDPLLQLSGVTGEDCELEEFDAVQEGFPSLLVGSSVQ